MSKFLHAVANYLDKLAESGFVHYEQPSHKEEAVALSSKKKEEPKENPEQLKNKKEASSLLKEILEVDPDIDTVNKIASDTVALEELRKKAELFRAPKRMGNASDLPARNETGPEAAYNRFGDFLKRGGHV